MEGNPFGILDCQWQSFFQFCKWEFFAKSNLDRIEQIGSPSFMMMNQEQDFTITFVTAHSTTYYFPTYVLHSMEYILYPCY